MASPLGRVLAAPVAPHLSPAQNYLDATSHPRSRLWLCFPDRLEDLHDEGSVDGIDRQRPNDRVYVCLQRGIPLSAMLVVLPADLVARNVGLGALLKGCGARSLCL